MANHKPVKFSENLNGLSISGIILAGGKSSRMGTDKGFIPLNGKPFIEHIIKAITPLVDEIMIVSDDPNYNYLGIKRIEDLIKDAGPIAGLYSGLYHSKTEYNLVLSCDVPLIKTEVLNKLIEGFDTNFDVIQLQSQNKTMPLIAIYKKQCMHKFLNLLQNNKRRLQFAIKQLNTKTILLNAEFDEFVKNINTIDELKAIKDAVEH